LNWSLRLIRKTAACTCNTTTTNPLHQLQRTTINLLFSISKYPPHWIKTSSTICKTSLATNWFIQHKSHCKGILLAMLCHCIHIVWGVGFQVNWRKRIMMFSSFLWFTDVISWTHDDVVGKWTQVRTPVLFNCWVLLLWFTAALSGSALGSKSDRVAAFFWVKTCPAVGAWRSSGTNKRAFMNRYLTEVVTSQTDPQMRDLVGLHDQPNEGRTSLRSRPAE
jgi:hypothetical protein